VPPSGSSRAEEEEKIRVSAVSRSVASAAVARQDGRFRVYYAVAVVLTVVLMVLPVVSAGHMTGCRAWSELAQPADQGVLAPFIDLTVELVLVALLVKAALVPGRSMWLGILIAAIGTCLTVARALWLTTLHALGWQIMPAGFVGLAVLVLTIGLGLVHAYGLRPGRTRATGRVGL
jgi:hypothetical protein